MSMGHNLSNGRENAHKSHEIWHNSKSSHSSNGCRLRRWEGGAKEPEHESRGVRNEYLICHWRSFEMQFELKLKDRKREHWIMSLRVETKPLNTPYQSPPKVSVRNQNNSSRIIEDHETWFIFHSLDLRITHPIFRKSLLSSWRRIRTETSISVPLPHSSSSSDITGMEFCSLRLTYLSKW